MVWNTEAVRERDAVARVTVDQLDHAGRRARRPHTLVEPLVVDRVDQPDAAARDQRVRATLQEPVLDPAEAGVELVYRFHKPAQRSKPGNSLARAAAISSSTSNGMRRNSTASSSSSTSVYSQNGW